MPATQTANPNPSTFESVWALIQELGEKQKELRESLKETIQELGEKNKENAEGQKELRESLKETERLMKESEQQQKKKNDEFYEKLGHLTNLFGDVTEAMIAPKICEKFEAFGFNFPRANPNVIINDRVNDISFEIDIMLENGDKAMLVEVKTKLTAERINKTIEKLKKMRQYANLHGDKRAFLGAVAGIVTTDEIKKYALEQGFYFIEYAGENFYITPPSGKPKEW
jgi:Holliday junction resolvase-like predicted endonuclease/regulator of replication initiation timing